ncbi:MAG: trans-acting enoyl reductase family protein [Granulosicoccus sp.]
MKDFLIYGATGYTGNLIAKLALARGLKPILAGRNATALSAMSNALGLEYRVGQLERLNELDEVLKGMTVVVNAAGPFASTAEHLVAACLRNKTHYVDVAGEIPVFESLCQKDADAKQSNIMVMPGVGFVVLASDCLATHVASRLPNAEHLRFAVSRTTLFSRGSAKTMMELFDGGIKIRRKGALCSVGIGSLERQFDFGQGPKDAVVVSWPDVFTAYRSTSIPNIETYFETGPMERSLILYVKSAGWLMQLPFSRPILNAQLSFLPQGPSERQRASEGRVIVAEAEDASGRVARSRLTTKEAYSFTAQSTLLVVSKILSGEWSAGYQTPAQLYGINDVTALEGVCLEDLVTPS